MSLSTRVKVTAYSVMVAYAIALYAYGITLPDAATRTLGLIPTGVVALFALVDNWLWAKRPFLFLMGQPLLKGTWYGELTSYRRDDAAPSDPVTKPVVLVIGQTLTTLHLTLMTGESKSRSGAAHILKKHTNDYVVSISTKMSQGWSSVTGAARFIQVVRRSKSPDCVPPAWRASTGQLETREVLIP